MEFRKEELSLEQAKQTDMVGYLSSLGYEPVKIKGNSYWYLSPLRDEKTASFKVNTRLNRWFDFGLGKGGSILDFCMLYMDVPLTEAVRLISGSILTWSPPVVDEFAADKKQNKLAVLGDFQLTSAVLTRYLYNRGIPVQIAAKYCREIRYQAGKKIYYGIGLQSDSGGWEIRNPYFKGSASPKDVTTIHSGCQRLSVFEGFFDLLTYLAIADRLLLTPSDLLVLNSLSFVEKTRPVLQAYARVDLYLDNDAAGKNVSLSLTASAGSYIDQSYRYASCKDLNEFWVSSKGNTSAFGEINLRPP